MVGAYIMIVVAAKPECPSGCLIDSSQMLERLALQIAQHQLLNPEYPSLAQLVDSQP